MLVITVALMITSTVSVSHWQQYQRFFHTYSLQYDNSTLLLQHLRFDRISVEFVRMPAIFSVRLVADFLPLPYNSTITFHRSLYLSHLLSFSPFCMLPLAAMAPKKNTGAYLRMVFTTNSLRNTTVSVEDDTLYYEIVTHSRQPHLTKISKLDADTREMVLVAEIERVPGSTVRVRFGGDDAEWINELDFMSWDLEKRWAC
jgi:hypothetical protein